MWFNLTIETNNSTRKKINVETRTAGCINHIEYFVGKSCKKLGHYSIRKYQVLEKSLHERGTDENDTAN